ncbi:hypothetical protein DFS34DRAFT_221050, partial [Phlyctochytrium arcticum]
SSHIAAAKTSCRLVFVFRVFRCLFLTFALSLPTKSLLLSCIAVDLILRATLFDTDDVMQTSNRQNKLHSGRKFVTSWLGNDLETLLDHPKDLFNGIAEGQMTQIEEFFFVLRSEGIQVRLGP